MNKKRVIGALFGLILLIFAIVASNDSSSFSKSFEDILKNADSGDFTVISNEVEDKEETGVLGSIFGLDEEGEEEDPVSLKEGINPEGVRHPRLPSDV